MLALHERPSEEPGAVMAQAGICDWRSRLAGVPTSGNKVRIRRKVIIGLLSLPCATILLLSTIFNEAFKIKRAYPQAQVSVSHRFGPVFSLWDVFGFLVPGDYVSPIDFANVAIKGSRKPIDLAKLLSFQVAYVQIVDSEIADFEILLKGHEPNIPIELINPVFPGASPQDLENLEKHKRPYKVSGMTIYFFGSV